MLSRAFEWYRIVNVKPSSEMIDRRAAAARDILKAIDSADDWDLALACAAGVVAGFQGNFTQESPAVQSLVGAIRTHESAFPQDLSENALELRACASVVLGEVLVRKGDQAPPPDAVLVASVLRSGLGPRPSPKGKYLKQMLDELDATAAKVLASGGIARRRRPVTAAQRFEKLAEPPDLATAWKSLMPALKAASKDLAQQSEIDREEVNVLWWMFAGVSSTTGQSIAEMPSGAAALCCGAELADQCLVPPASSLEAMVGRAFETGRPPRELVARGIEEFVADWGDKLPSLLVPDEATREFAQKYPLLVPVSWLGARLLASKGATQWKTEFERMSDVPTKHALNATRWAIQAFRERVAYRVYESSRS